jgi:hypothetical protein
VAKFEHLQLLSRGVQVWDAWRESHRDVSPDFSGADMRKRMLRGFDFSGSNFSGADLRDTNLRRADLRAAKLDGAKLYRALLSATKLFFANKPEYFRRVRNTLRSNGRLLLAAWTGSMDHSRVRDVAQHFACPQLCTAEEYVDFIQASGMQVDNVVDTTSFVVPTWQICLRRIERFRRFRSFFPQEVRSFAEGIAVVLDAYLSGELAYTVLTARQ